ncbi:MAG: T9SS type A sorting domain-containing protein, partial [Ignavibacteria bacterium]
TKISYELPSAGFVTLKVYDVLGKEVSVLLSQRQNAGKYSLNFNASNLTSGVYFYKIESGNFNEIKRMVLLK